MSHDEDSLLAWLPTVALFGGLKEATLHHVIALLEKHKAHQGEVICKQGEPGRELFLVQSGEVAVYRDLPNGRRRQMLRMGAGEFFGEMTIIDIQKRSATVVVEQPAILYSLSNQALYSLYRQDIGGYVMILQNLCRELSRRLRATNAKVEESSFEP